MADDFNVPSYLSNILHILQQNNHHACVVGGAVRDMIMGREPHDYDVVTSAEVEEILQVFDKALPIGDKHGTAVVFMDGRQVEISRCKSSSGQKYNWPAWLIEDLYHRDFTINAIAVAEDGSLFDPFGGLNDIENTSLRSPEDQSGQRFQEDPLRMLRAVRLCTVLNFQASPIILEAISEYGALLSNVSRERIRDELVKILLSEQPGQGVMMLVETGLMQYIMPEVLPMVAFEQHNPHHLEDVFSHSLKVLDNVPARLPLRLAAMFHDIAKPETFSRDENGIGHYYQHDAIGGQIARAILERLKFDRLTVERVAVLIQEHMHRFAAPSRAAVKRLINRVGRENIEDLFCLQKADILGGAPPFELFGIEETEAIARQILVDQEPLTVKDLVVNGYDLIQMGFNPGPKLGSILQGLLEVVICEPEKNRKEILLGLAADWMHE